MSRKINQLFSRHDGGKKIVIIVVVAVVIIVAAVIYLVSCEEKTPLEELAEDKGKIVNDLTNLSEEEQIIQEERIASIESVVNEAMAGTNNQGSAYLKSSLVDRRVSEVEEYLADVEFYQDQWEWTSDITLEQKDRKEYNAIKEKCAELFKQLYGTENKVYYARCRAYYNNGSNDPAFSALIPREVSEGVDWSQSVETLANDVLPKVWNAWINDYSIYD
ncbi:hypothetical protein KKG41_00070 [Patescibacteria group bacterium]|nr:hypothetical protein [Patescibacteria group bacterium]MBU1890568.1 hypothetical protein [Patescibacteria group bacterium]